ncbi:MAG: high-potential iron-sulfur protein [Bdellovibrionota bacterium]
MNRRSFFQSVGAFIGAAALLPIVARAEGRRGGGTAASTGPQLVDPKDRQAQSVNYVETNTALKDKTLMNARGGVQFKDQKCKNCAFYDGGKEVTTAGKKAGPCQMPFAGGKMVTADGWCSSWAKKA